MLLCFEQLPEDKWISIENWSCVYLMTRKGMFVCGTGSLVSPLKIKLIRMICAIQLETGEDLSSQYEKGEIFSHYMLSDGISQIELWNLVKLSLCSNFINSNLIKY